MKARQDESKDQVKSKDPPDGCGVHDDELLPPAATLPAEHRRRLTPPSRWLADLHRDLEVTSPPAGGSATPTLAVALGAGQTRLKGGKAYVEALVSHPPCSDVRVLRERQNVWKRLEAEGLGADADATTSERLAELEADALWFFRLEEDESMRAVVQSAYFDVWPVTRLNTGSPAALSARMVYQVAVSPLVSLLSPVVYFIVPFIVLRMAAPGAARSMGFVEYLGHMLRSATEWTRKLAASRGLAETLTSLGHGISAIFSMAMYFSSVVSSFRLSSTLRRVCNTVSARVEGAMEFARLVRRRADATGWDGLVAEALFPLCEADGRGRAAHQQATSPSLPERRTAPATLLGAAALCGGGQPLDLNAGHRLCEAAKFDTEAAKAALRCAYAMDAAAAVLRTKATLGMCWAEYVEDDNAPKRTASTPTFDLKGVRHPCLDPDSTPNDWNLGTPNKRHAILTGPNAGGKSTLMKAVLCAALTAQTVCMAAASSCRLSPFDVISSHLNIADTAGSESLFQAEMGRALRVIRDIDGMREGGKALVVLDEIFSSTNPIEGIAAAAAVAKRIARHPGTTSVVSTHFLHLCGLLRKTHEAYGMPVQLNLDLRPTGYPYRLTRGACRQYIALELMRGSGFDENVLRDAIEVKRTLVRPRPTIEGHGPATDEAKGVEGASEENQRRQ